MQRKTGNGEEVIEYTIYILILILFSFGFIGKTRLVVRLRARLFFLALITTFQPRRLHIWTKPNVNTLLLTLRGRGGGKTDSKVRRVGERCRES